MKTLKISNGNLVVDQARGQLKIVDSAEKAAQDVASSILKEFNPFFQEGNEIFNSGIGQIFNTEGLVTQLISEAINRMIVKLQGVSDEAKPVNIKQLLVDSIEPGTFVFLAEVNLAGGDSTGLADKILMSEPTALDQLFAFNDRGV